MISTRLAVSVSDFYDSLQDKFLKSYAYVMGIPVDRIQVRPAKKSVRPKDVPKRALSTSKAAPMSWAFLWTTFWCVLPKK
jgi:hypothetical protein